MVKNFSCQRDDYSLSKSLSSCYILIIFSLIFLLFLFGNVEADYQKEFYSKVNNSSNNQSFFDWINLGDVHFEKEMYQQALSDYYNALEHNPEDPNIRYKVGLAQYMLGDLKNAEVNINLSIQENVTPDALFYYGTICYALKQYSKSIQLLSQYLEIYPDDSYALFNIGQAFEQDGKYLLALYAYKNATLKDPSYAKPWYFIGSLYSSFGNQEDARNAFLNYTKLAPNDDRGWFALSKEEYILKNYNQSIISIENAKKLNPGIQEYEDYFMLYAGEQNNTSKKSKDVSLSYISLIIPVFLIFMYSRIRGKFFVKKQ